MIVPVMAISNLKLTQQIYSEETNGTHAHDRDRVPLNCTSKPRGKVALVLIIRSEVAHMTFADL